MDRTESNKTRRSLLLSVGIILFTLFGFAELLRVMFDASANAWGWLGPIAMWALAFAVWRQSKRSAR